MKLRWGIISAGLISNDFANAVNSLPKDQHSITCVGARSKETAQKFANKLKIPKAYGSYDEVCRDPDVDIVYIGSIIPTHLPVVRSAFDNGKHVLCEKSMALSVAETEEMVWLAKKKNLFLMEAMWTRCMPSFRDIRAALKAGKIGEVLRVDVNFGFNGFIQSRFDDCGFEGSRMVRRELGGSTTLDMGIYCVQLATLAFEGDPEEIIGSGFSHPKEETDMATTNILVYKGGKFATLNTDVRTDMSNEGYIYGTKGRIKVCRPMHAPYEILINNEKKTYASTQEGYNFENSYFLRHQATRVRECLMAGMKEMPEYPLAESLKHARIMAKMMKNAGARPY